MRWEGKEKGIEEGSHKVARGGGEWGGGTNESTRKKTWAMRERRGRSGEPNHNRWEGNWEWYGGHLGETLKSEKEKVPEEPKEKPELGGNNERR